MTVRELAELLPLTPAEIRAVRRKGRITQREFARRLNVSLSTVQKWEIGDKHPEGATLKLLQIVRREGLAILSETKPDAGHTPAPGRRVRLRRSAG